MTATMSSLILKRAATSNSSGEWNDLVVRGHRLLPRTTGVAVGTKRTRQHVRSLSAFEAIVLQKSSRRGWSRKIRNNRIGANGFLNQRCASTPDLESILRARMGKIVLQHNRGQSGPLVLRSSFSAFGPQADLPIQHGVSPALLKRRHHINPVEHFQHDGVGRRLAVE